MSEENYKPGVGLDVGTAFIQRARTLVSGDVEFLTQRDAFLEITPISDHNAKIIEMGLKAKNAFYLKKNGVFYIVGQHAVETATEQQKSVERPLKRGVLDAKDKDSFGMLSKIIEILLGKAIVGGESCFYSYPADPIDETFDAVYHQSVIGKILKNLNYTPNPILEAEALAYSELLNDGLTGIAISWGAGQTNVAIVHMGITVMSFSVARGGDWVDTKVEEDFGHPATVVQAEKEAGVDLLNPRDELHDAISERYNKLIDYVVGNLALQFKNAKNMPNFRSPVNIVISGGTSKAANFIPVFEETIRRHQINLNIGEIRSAADPMTAVANGCLIAAQL